MRIGSLEAGGTKMVCAIGDEYGNIVKQTQFPTKTPNVTIPQLVNFFLHEEIDALGIGCLAQLIRTKVQKPTATLPALPN